MESSTIKSNESGTIKMIKFKLNQRKQFQEHARIVRKLKNKIRRIAHSQLTTLVSCRLEPVVAVRIRQEFD